MITKHHPSSRHSRRLRGLAWAVLAALLFLAAHVWSASAPRDADGGPRFSAPPNFTTIRILAGGRNTAAAGVLWVLTVQRLGDARFHNVGAPHLEDWVQRIQDLEPALITPPLFGSLTLMSTAARPAAAEQILARAERARPDAFEVPYYRAINAFFGSQDIPAAISHLHRASAMTGAPAFLSRWATRLETQQLNCSTMIVDLQALKQNDAAAFSSVDANSVYRNCVAREIERAMAAYRIRYQHPPMSIDELLKDGFLTTPPPRPPGQCWSLEATSAKLGDCAKEGPLRQDSPPPH